MFLCLWLLHVGLFLMPVMGFYPYKPSEIPENEIAMSTDKTHRRSGPSLGDGNEFSEALAITLSMNRRAPPVGKANSNHFKIRL